MKLPDRLGASSLELYFSGSDYFDSLEYVIYNESTIYQFLKSKALFPYPIDWLSEEYYRIGWTASDIRARYFTFEENAGISYADFSKLILNFDDFSIRLETHNGISNYFDLFLTARWDNQTASDYQNLIVWNEETTGRISSTLQLRGLTDDFFNAKIIDPVLRANSYQKKVLDRGKELDIIPFAPNNIINFMRGQSQVYWSYESGREEEYVEAKNSI